MAAGTAYSKRYAGNFADGSGGGTPIDSVFLNAVEAALLQLIGAAPTADGQVAQWDNANTRYGPALILNKNVDPAAAIAKSKLDLTGANGIVNADVAAAAAIAYSKLNLANSIVSSDIVDGTITNSDINAAASINLSKLAVVPGYAYERRTTAVDVNNTSTEKSLYDGSTASASTGWTIAGGDLSTNKLYRLTLMGDALYNNSATDTLTLKIKFNNVGMYQYTPFPGSAVGTGAARHPWTLTIWLANLGATNSQLMTAVMTGENMNTGTPTTGKGIIDMANNRLQGGTAQGTGAVDTTTSQKLDVTVTWNATSVNDSWKCIYALSELI